MRRRKPAAFVPRVKNEFPNLRIEQRPGVAPVSNGFANCSGKNDPLQHRWKKESQHSEEETHSS